jgi:hypothetical protein
MTAWSVLVAGEAQGEGLVLAEPLSLWGGFDSETGLVIDVSHEQLGVSLTDRIVVMPHGRGSSSSSAVLAEAMRRGTAPAGFVLSEPDPILVIGSLVGEHLYGVSCPIVVSDGPAPHEGIWRISDGEVVLVEGA